MMLKVSIMINGFMYTHTDTYVWQCESLFLLKVKIHLNGQGSKTAFSPGCYDQPLWVAIICGSSVTILTPKQVSPSCRCKATVVCPSSPFRLEPLPIFAFLGSAWVQHGSQQRRISTDCAPRLADLHQL